MCYTFPRCMNLRLQIAEVTSISSIKVSQGHRQFCYSVDYIWLAISISQWLYLIVSKIKRTSPVLGASVWRWVHWKLNKILCMIKLESIRYQEVLIAWRSVQSFQQPAPHRQTEKQTDRRICYRAMYSCTTPCHKNVPPLACCNFFLNFDTCERILTFLAEMLPIK